MKHKCTHYFGVLELRVLAINKNFKLLQKLTQNNQTTWIIYLVGSCKLDIYTSTLLFFIGVFLFCLAIKINNTDNKWGFKRHIKIHTHTHTHTLFIICIRPFFILCYIYLFIFYLWKTLLRLHKTWVVKNDWLVG